MRTARRKGARSLGRLFSNSIIISTGLSQFEFLQPIPIRDLRIPAHRGDAYVSNLIQTPTVLGHSIQKNTRQGIRVVRSGANVK
jgi:hypothetical protein